MISWKRFFEQLVRTILKLAIIYWLFIVHERVVMVLLTKSYCIAFIISFSFVVLMILWYIKKEGGRCTLTFESIRWQMWVWTLLLCIAQYMLLSVLRGKIPTLIAKDQITMEFIIASFTIVLCGPIVEEIMFRGFLQKHLSIKLPPWLAILITSTLFALAHYKIISNILPAFMVGIFCGIIYYRTNKLILCILYHSFFNLLGWFLQLSSKYDNLALRILILVLVIGLAFYSIRGFTRDTSLCKNNVS